MVKVSLLAQLILRNVIKKIDALNLNFLNNARGGTD